MGKVKKISGFVPATLDKLPGIRADLVRLDDNWQEWRFPELIESLRRWCDRNPILMEDRKPDLPNRHPPKRSPVFQAKDESPRKVGNCVYCNIEDHRPFQCMQKVLGYTVTVASVDGKFQMTTQINKVDKGVLLTVPNPRTYQTELGNSG